MPEDSTSLVLAALYGAAVSGRGPVTASFLSSVTHQSKRSVEEATRELNRLWHVSVVASSGHVEITDPGLSAAREMIRNIRDSETVRPRLRQLAMAPFTPELEQRRTVQQLLGDSGDRPPSSTAPLLYDDVVEAVAILRSDTGVIRSPESTPAVQRLLRIGWISQIAEDEDGHAFALSEAGVRELAEFSYALEAAGRSLEGRTGGARTWARRDEAAAVQRPNADLPLHAYLVLATTPMPADAEPQTAISERVARIFPTVEPVDMDQQFATLVERGLVAKQKYGLWGRSPEGALLGRSLRLLLADSDRVSQLASIHSLAGPDAMQLSAQVAVTAFARAEIVSIGKAGARPVSNVRRATESSAYPKDMGDLAAIIDTSDEPLESARRAMRLFGSGFPMLQPIAQRVPKLREVRPTSEGADIERVAPTGPIIPRRSPRKRDAGDVVDDAPVRARGFGDPPPQRSARALSGRRRQSVRRPPPPALQRGRTEQRAGDESLRQDPPAPSGRSRHRRGGDRADSPPARSVNSGDGGVPPETANEPFVQPPASGGSSPKALPPATDGRGTGKQGYSSPDR